MADWRKIRASNFRSWLSGLPDEIYDKRETSHIVRLLDALCGDNGVGYLRKKMILKRLQTSLYETRYNDLDTVYSALFNLPRLKEEQYEYREDSLLVWSEINEMNMKDAMYRNRIWCYMLSFQYGGTIKGLELSGQAATGIRCEVVDGMLYYRSAGIDESYQDEVSGQPVNYNGSIDFNGTTILVDTDEELTAEQRYNLSSITARLRPVDVHHTFMTRGELMDSLCFFDKDDEYIQPTEVEGSSHWWRVARYVTGRPDWGLNARNNEWIEANVTKEAPQQLLVNSQEASYDFTPMIKTAVASSEHAGRYNAEQRRIFESLGAVGADSPKDAFDAVSRASSRIVTNGYYGDIGVIDGAYPTSYSSQLRPFYTEVGRSHRYWSSEEREGTESLEFELTKLVPVNRISFAIYRKPVRVRVYLSSYKDEDGKREWVEAHDIDNNRVVYTHSEWGGTASGELISVDFDMRRVRCDAIRITFERLDIPHYSSVGDAYEVDEFKWSVECCDVSVKYIVREESDFVATTYEDMFGNRVDTALKTMDAEYAIDGNPDTYWISQPNLGENAVEYLILKVADKPTRINFVELDAIYSGCQMNVYSTDRDEPGYWKPYPKVYMLRTGRTYLPMRKVTYIKLEFTFLNAIPYDVEIENVPVVSRRFPWDVKKYIEDRMSETYELTVEQQLLLPQDPLLYDNGSPENVIGIEDVYIREDVEDLIDPVAAKNMSVVGWSSNGSYRMYQDNAFYDIYGEDMALEDVRPVTPEVSSYGERSFYYRFSEEGTHEYEVETFFRTQNLAYVVGVKDVRFGFNGRIFSAKMDETFYLYMQDGRYIDINDGWDNVRGERMKPSSDSRLNYFETVNMQKLYPFRSFEMVTNQKPPYEKFSHPSDMSQEWHGIGVGTHAVEMGLSGTVLMSDRGEAGSAIESEPKLTRSMAIAKAQVDVYPMVSGKWEFECRDLFGESVFNLYYDLEAQKWQTVAATFVPTPGGSWWDADYDYRVRIPIEGPVAKDSCVFVPVVDFDALWENNMLDRGLTKLRVVYFDGITAREIPADVTDSMELWFKLVQDVPEGKSADGRYDYDSRMLYGSYYIYFGDGVAQDEPMRDYRDIFSNGPYRMTSDVAWGELLDLTWGELLKLTWELNEFRVMQDGTIFRRDFDMLEVEDEFFLPDKGFVTMEFTLERGLERVDGTGVSETRFLMDYSDAWKSMKCYFHERQIVFVVIDKDGFESAFVSKNDILAQEGVKSNILLEWDKKGTASILKALFYRWGDIAEVNWWDMLERKWDYIKRDENGNQVVEIDVNDLRRRWLGVWVDSSTQLECISNVYDEKLYSDTWKRY